MNLLRRLKTLGKKRKIVLLILMALVLLLSILLVTRPWEKEPKYMPTQLILQASSPESTRLGLTGSEHFSTDISHLSKGYWGVVGGWTQDADSLISIGSDSILTIRPLHSKVTLTAESVEKNSFAAIDVSVDDTKKPEVIVSKLARYVLIDEPGLQDGSILNLKVPSGIKLYNFSYEP